MGSRSFECSPPKTGQGSHLIITPLSSASNPGPPRSQQCTPEVSSIPLSSPVAFLDLQHPQSSVQLTPATNPPFLEASQVPCKYEAMNMKSQ